MSSIIRIFSIFAYLFIFLQGSMIAVPMGLLLVVGIFTAEPLMMLFLGLADFALLILLFIPQKKGGGWKMAIEILLFLLLLLPLIYLLMTFSITWFNNALFMVPLTIFVVLYFWSVMLDYRMHRKAKRVGAAIIDEFAETSQSDTATTA
jgi:hypothetical protein